MGLFIDPAKVVEYLPKGERTKPEAERVTFRLGVLTASQYAMVQDLVVARSDSKYGQHVVVLLKYGLRGWNGPGAPKYETGVDGYITEACIGRLSGLLRMELASELDTMNTVGHEEGKASASSSPEGTATSD